jgi:ATP-dependent DNA ligase
MNAPAASIHPCQPVVAKQPPIGPGWAHELKHDGYRLQCVMIGLREKFASFCDAVHRKL